MTTKFISMQGWDEFEKTFKPKQNHIVPNNNVNFETYGEEWEYIKSLDPHYVWTWVDGDLCSLLVNGVAWVNRINYHVCEVPWEDDVDYEVILSTEEECKCYKEDGYEDGEYGDVNCQECEGYGYVTNYIN